MLFVPWHFPDHESPRSANCRRCGEIHGGKLDWRDDSPVMLAEGKILALSRGSRSHGGSLRSPADFQFEFGSDSVRIFSLFGETEISYPLGYVIATNATDARPVWGAWAPDILGLAADRHFLAAVNAHAGTLLATFMFYLLPVWLLLPVASNRDLNFRASWRLAGAALMPGARCWCRGRWCCTALGGFDYCATVLRLRDAHCH